MGLGLSATNRRGKLERIERQTRTLLVLVFSWDFVDNNKNKEHCQPYGNGFQSVIVIACLCAYWEIISSLFWYTLNIQYSLRGKIPPLAEESLKSTLYRS